MRQKWPLGLWEGKMEAGLKGCVLVTEADWLIPPRKEHATDPFVEPVFTNHLLCAFGPGSLPVIDNEKKRQ